MATTSLWRVKGRIGNVLRYAQNPDKTEEKEIHEFSPEGEDEALNEVIAYASREDATEVRKYVSGINCSPGSAKSEMLAVKRKFGKLDGTVAYHGYQSFKENEVTPEIAHEIGRTLADRLWGDRYQVIVATHLDKQSHIHNHFVINTVSFTDGIKFHRTKEDYAEMQKESDQLCREYGLSVVNETQNRSKSYAEWNAERNGKPTVRSLIRDDIDDAVRQSESRRDFIRVMKQKGYEFKLINERGYEYKHPSLKPPDAKGFFRFDGLGEGYDLTDIDSRVLKNYHGQLPFPEERFEEKRARKSRDLAPMSKLTGLQKLYFRYCYELGIIRRHPKTNTRVSFDLREESLKLEKLDKEQLFLGKNNITTLEELNAFEEKTDAELNRFVNIRKILRNDLKRALRAGNEAEAAELRERISQSSEVIKALRNDLKLCSDIKERAQHIMEKVSQIEQEEKKEENNEHIKRRSGTGRETYSRWS